MLFNVIIILILGLFTVNGLKKGIISQTVMFIGTILIYIIAFFLKNPVADFLFRICPFFNFAGDLEGLVALNVIIYQLIAFVVVSALLFAIFGLILKLTGLLQKAVDLTFVLSLPSKILGAIVGFLEGYIIVFLVLTLCAIPLSSIGINSSPLAEAIMYKSPILSKSLGGLNEALEDIFTLVGDGYDEDMSKNEANLETMDTLLKYKVIKPSSVDILIDNKKLEKVKGIEEVVDKYRGE